MGVRIVTVDTRELGVQLDSLQLALPARLRAFVRQFVIDLWQVKTNIAAHANSFSQQAR